MNTTIYILYKVCYYYYLLTLYQDDTYDENMFTHELVLARMSNYNVA